MRSRIGYALLCCSAMCCVAQLIVHLHLAWLCNCVCCTQGNTFLYVFRRRLRVSEFQVSCTTVNRMYSHGS